MNVGIYTIHRANNYGAMLQAFATQYIVKSLGYNAEIVNLYSSQWDRRNNYIGENDSLKSVIKNIYALCMPSVWRKSELFRSFHESMSLSKRYTDEDEIYKTPPIYDVHLVGSDQVWNIEKGFSSRNYFFLDFLQGEEKRASYASSFGNTNVNEAMFPQLKRLLSKFSAISVRESDGVDLVMQATGKTATQVLDPTLLLSGEQWKSILDIEQPIVKGKYILYYGFDNKKESQRVIDSIRKLMGIPVVAVSATITTPYKFDRFIQAAGPKEFVNLFSNATYVITSSFHGLAFALNFQRDFVVIRHGTRMSRMESLLQALKLSERIIGNESELEILLNNKMNIDYTEPYAALIRERDRSIGWLSGILQGL